ncbi:hypothetical protein Cgig2_030723 [Carnegiea gigantea]|uniref:Lipid desaturase domain-containing protein n=1 Tax=Carnegiea gigantea TaxID=171969 RepID=A0A9Q1QDP4_9CARY|nr:hypothetical protein Cgig2_030723 [Carnegiea gigantea]
MSILSQQKYIPKLAVLYNSRSTHLNTHIATGVYCAAMAPLEPKPSISVTRSVVEPSPLGPVPAQVKTSEAPRPNDPGLKSTWAHRAWLASGCTTVLVSLAKSIEAVAGSHIWAEPILAALVGYILADLGSGVYHWAIDNYGDATTPILGAQIEAFQGHHKWPWTITRRQFANNLHALARVITFMTSSYMTQPNSRLSGCIMFSQQFHAWAHSTKSKLPKIVVGLQDLGVLVSRSQHADHHRPPYNSNYCIVSGVWNKFLDENKIFEILEMMLFFQLGLRPRSWSEPGLEWTEESSTPSS